MISITKNQIQPYELDKNNFLKKSVGKARCLFISWEEIADQLEMDYESQLLELGATEENLINYAFTATEDYAVELEDFDENQKVEFENGYLYALKHHWSLKNILLKHLRLQGLIDKLNTWAEKGPRSKHLFVGAYETGRALDFFINGLGVSFTVHESFIVPHTELYYEQTDTLPEWNFDDLTASDVLDTLLSLAISEGNPIMIDLSGWHEKLRVSE